MVRSSDYSFLSGKIRALEAALPKQADYERMVDAPSYEQAVRVLVDLKYVTDQELQSGMSAEDAIERDMVETKHMLANYGPEPFLEQLLFLNHDFHNVHVILKEIIFGIELSHVLSPLGTWPLHELRRAVVADKPTDDSIWKEFPGAVEAIAAFRAIAAARPDPAAMERMLAPLYYATSLRIAARVPDAEWFLSRIRKNIDRINGLAAARAVGIGFGALPEGTLVEGGATPVSFWTAVFDTKKIPSNFPGPSAALAAFQGVLAGTDAAAAVEKAWEGDLVSQQREIISYSYGPQVAYVFFQAKRQAAKNMRLIVSGKKQGFSRDAITSSLRIHV